MASSRDIEKQNSDSDLKAKGSTWKLNKLLTTEGVKIHSETVTIYDDYAGPSSILDPPILRHSSKSDVSLELSPPNIMLQSQITPSTQVVLIKSSDDELPLTDSSRLTTSNSSQLTDSKSLMDSSSKQSVAKKEDTSALLESQYFTMIIPTPIPLAQRHEADYEKISENISESFHNIFRMRKRHHRNRKKPRSIYFFKQDKVTPINPNMYELEATTCSYYRLIAPHHAPQSGRAIYDSNFHKIGVLMKAIPGFKSTLQDPLKESDFPIEALKELSIEDLDEIDERARREGMDLENKPDSKIICEIFVPVKSATGQSDEKAPLKTIKVTARDLKNFRTMKGLGIGLTTSYIFEEDDCHTGNMSKDGKRIDFDMSPWPINFNFKNIGPIDWTFRAPGNRFNVTARDIRSFPILKDAAPWYWPTTPAPYFPETFIKAASKFFTVSQNPFQSTDNAIYQKLATNPVFNYYKYMTFLKYVLSGADIYRSMSQLHMSDEKNIELMAKHQAERMKMIKTELLKVPEFHDFLRKHGDHALKKILSEFADHNNQNARKIEKNPLYKLQVLNLENVVNEYVDICKSVKVAKNPDTIKEDVDVAELLFDNSNIFERKM